MVATVLRGRPGASVTIRGGGRVKRILMRSRGITPEVLARITAEVLRQELLPLLRSRVPRRTGRLARSLVIRHRGGAVELRGTFYAPVVRWNNGRDSVAAAAMDILESNRDDIIKAIAAQIRQRLGV